MCYNVGSAETSGEKTALAVNISSLLCFLCETRSTSTVPDIGLQSLYVCITNARGEHLL